MPLALDHDAVEPGSGGRTRLELPIETDRLRLRRYRTSDVPDIVAYSSHPSILRLVDWKTPDGLVTADSVAEFIRKQSQVVPGGPSWLDLAVALKSDDRVIGTIGIVCREHEQGRIGWALAVEHRGKGLATEAAATIIDYGFSSLGCHRIDAVTTVWNERSWRLMERLGMRREGHFRESEFARGEWQDVLVYAVLKSEWVDADALQRSRRTPATRRRPWISLLDRIRQNAGQTDDTAPLL